MSEMASPRGGAQATPSFTDEKPEGQSTLPGSQGFEGALEELTPLMLCLQEQKGQPQRKEPLVLTVPRLRSTLRPNSCSGIYGTPTCQGLS